MFHIENVMGQEVETTGRHTQRGRVMATSCSEGGKVYVYVMYVGGHVDCHLITGVRFLQRWDPVAGEFVST
jgi:hypothetical protein